MLAEPNDPDENEEVNVEDLVYDVLHLSERNFKLLAEESMAIALDNFLSHNETGAPLRPSSNQPLLITRRISWYVAGRGRAWTRIASES